MAEYTAREWSNGDIVTASNLNQLENGLAECCEGGTAVIDVKIITSYGNILSVSHSAQEIFQALNNKQQVRLLWQTWRSSYDWDDSASYIVAYLDGYDTNLSYDENNYGTGYRFRTLAYDNGGSLSTFSFDVINMLDAGDYYWVFANNPSGKHE